MLKTCCSAFFCLTLVCVATRSQAENFQFLHENVLGTSLQLVIDSQDEATAKSVEKRALEEIDRLNAILSRYYRQSELMQWQAGSTTEVSSELWQVLSQAEQWRRTTNGAFDVRSQAISELWEKADATAKAPSDGQRQQLVRQLSAAPYQLAQPNHATTNGLLPLSLDGLAKGYVLDAVCQVVQQEFPEVQDFVVNIGGDLRKLGEAPLELSIENPRNAAEGAKPLQHFIATQPLAMATSGNYRRFVNAGGRQVSHIFDPRTGLPAESILSATVICQNAMDADALATAISVLGAEEGLALIENLSHTECCIVTANGNVVTSSGWPLGHLTTSPLAMVLKVEEETKQGLFVDFSIDRPEGGRRYRRPYVAMWLEDEDGYPVKTGILWLQTEQPGPRWHRDLTRWFRSDRIRKTVENTDLVNTISGATRGPGKYDAHFDGTDNLGKPLKPGQYTLCLEVAREHGTYQLIRESIEWGNTPIAEKKLEGNVEVGSMSYRFVPTTSEAGK
ncbi:DUF2271 domain-containing protein [Bremerella sp. JC817]|uniref:DUF2271 domain-containing protein n=1 Tax=Bremerella sp. JC817 TaxID=3231756 RepID=UPI003458C3A5